MIKPASVDDIEIRMTVGYLGDEVGEVVEVTMAGEGPVLAGQLLDSREILNNTTFGIQIKYFKTRIYMKYLKVCSTYLLLAMLL